MAEIRTVGFVGLGNMGFPMAGHLARAGFDLIVADAAPGVADRFVAAHGGVVAESLAAMGGATDAVITMLPTGAIVRQVVLGPGDCVAGGMVEGSLLIDMSTSNPVDTRGLGEDLAGRGIGMIDAPVAGGVIFATDALTHSARALIVIRQGFHAQTDTPVRHRQGSRESMNREVGTNA